MNTGEYKITNHVFFSFLAAALRTHKVLKSGFNFVFVNEFEKLVKLLNRLLRFRKMS